MDEKPIIQELIVELAEVERAILAYIERNPADRRPVGDTPEYEALLAREAEIIKQLKGE